MLLIQYEAFGILFFSAVWIWRFPNPAGCIADYLESYIYATFVLMKIPNLPFENVIFLERKTES